MVRSTPGAQTHLNHQNEFHVRSPIGTFSLVSVTDILVNEGRVGDGAEVPEFVRVDNASYSLDYTSSTSRERTLATLP